MNSELQDPFLKLKHYETLLSEEESQVKPLSEMFKDLGGSSEKVVYYIISCLSTNCIKNHTNLYYINEARIAKKLHFSKPTVKRGVDELKQNNHIKMHFPYVSLNTSDNEGVK